LINAETRGIGCRRKVITLVYSNDKRISDHLGCDRNSVQGCSHCALKLPAVCCDLCCSAAFEHLASVPTMQASKTTKKSNIKPYDATSSEHDLRTLLLEWRDKTVRETFGAAIFTNYGGNILLPTLLLQRIVDCAHAGKLTSLEQLKKETSWR
ncbi:hypothetical protein BKA93DRAFT_712309, partial [Sparassis latifolia]